MTTSIRLMLNKSRRLNDGRYPLVFQLIHCRRKKLLYMGHRICESGFDEKKGKVLFRSDQEMTNKEVAAINRAVRQIRKEILERISQLEQTGIPYTLNDLLPKRMQKPTRLYLLNHIDGQIVRKKSLGKDGTAAAYQSTRSSLAKYIGTDDIPMSDVTRCFVRDYADFLYRKGAASNTVSYYLRNFRALYNQAITDGYQPRTEYPFFKAQTRPFKTVKRAMSQEDMRTLISLQLDNTPELVVARDLYLFSFYAQGMAFVDIVHLKKRNISNGILIYSRHKSKQLIRIIITPEMERLMNKYMRDDEHIFPIINSETTLSDYAQYRMALAAINRHLKKIAAMLHIQQPLTTYTARHTWATMAHEFGAPVSVISEGLGHTSEEMTRIYLKEFDMKLLNRINTAVAKLSQPQNSSSG